MAVCLLLAACQSTAPEPAPAGTVTTIGNTTISTGGSVSVETGVVE